jgi:hypothetical protein
LCFTGDVPYYSIPAGGDRSRNAVWTYGFPFEAMVQIKDYVAFYPDPGRQNKLSMTREGAGNWRRVEKGKGGVLQAFSHSSTNGTMRRRAVLVPELHQHSAHIGQVARSFQPHQGQSRVPQI